MSTRLRGFWLLVAFTLAAPAGAQRSASPYDQRQRELGRRAERVRGPEGILPLLELWRNWDEADPAVTAEMLESIWRNRRVPADRRAYAGALLARARLRAGRDDDARALLAELGYVTDWQTVGPFDNEGKRGFGRAMGPETEPLAAFDPTQTWAGKERDVGWRRYPAITRVGYVNFDAIYRPTTNVCAYAATTIRSERPQALALWLGGGGATKMWWNGVEVHADDTYRRPDPDRSVALVGAHAGVNRLLVKACATDGTWGFYLRVAEPRGGQARGVRIDAESLPLAAGEGHGARLPRATPSILERLEAAAEGENAPGAALFDLARFLLWTGADDPAENRARQLAARAADASNAPYAHLELAARLQEHRSESMRLLQRALQRFGDDPRALLLQAQLQRSGLHPEDAMATLDRVERLRPQGVVAIQTQLLRAELLAHLSLPRSARVLVDALAPRVGEAHGFLVLRARYAEAVGDRDAALALRRRALDQQLNDVNTRRVLLADALRRRDLRTVGEHLEALRAIRPGSVNNLKYLAAVYEGIGETDRALELMALAREVAPEDASTLVAHGELLLRLGQPDAAIDALQLALRLRPQDAPTRELLEQIRPRERPDERYAVDAETLLSRRTEPAGYPTTTLQELTVNTVYDNGLGSSFRQLGVQIHDREGARQMRTYSIQFDPSSQRVDVRLARVYRDGETLEATQYFEQALGEPWYRIYYDTRALVVVFPDLEPGDVVELRWRVDDVAHRNIFADYYGDLTFLAGTTPIVHEEYILMTPTSRRFFFNEPRLTGLEHTRSEEAGTRVDRFVAENVAAIRTEPGMPGWTEIAPYLHVSTYETWEEVGRWYWGLIQDQLYADENLKQIVAELVRGKDDLREKVVAIHDWVMANTRYVGLEFGIHGYKPYRVPQIVSRGFGDCKDKASLLYTMFREAGIDAHVVLLRTRRNGNIHDLPASLAVFDHAIAYVPELDLYIDGTAEHSGVTELPTGDQGVTVLHVWPEGSALRRTPVLPPERNRHERHLQARLARDGSATLDAREIVRGSSAPSYRATFQAEGTRAERLERQLRNLFPGLRLRSQRFGDLNDLEAPVTLEYAAEVPQLAQRDGELLRTPPSVLGELTSRFARAPRRHYPLDLGGTSQYVEERILRLPAGTRLRSAPSGGEADSPFGRLRLTVETHGRQVTARTEFELRRDRVEPNEYAAFRQWIERADQLLRERVIIEGAQ